MKLDSYYWIRFYGYDWEPAQYTKYGWLVLGRDQELSSNVDIHVGEIIERNEQS